MPVHAFYYGAADKGTECYTESSDSSPNTNSSSTQPLGYGSTQQCKGKRHNGRAADSLKSTGRDEGADIITDTAPCRGGSKYKDSKEEDGAASKPVGQCRGHENAGRKGQGIGVYCPGELFQCGSQICPNDWKGIGDDEVIEGSHEHRNGQ